MRLAISNIAWDVTEDSNIATLLQHYGIDAIDIAPGKYFPQPADATSNEIASVRAYWSDLGIEITGMQALLFGTTGLNVFGTQESQDAMLRHLGHVCRIGGALGACRLVFGSPKNRDRSGLADDQVAAIAAPFFRRLGDIADAAGVFVCLEPNPPCYGANFMTDSNSTAAIVREVDHPAIRMQLDIGAVTLNAEDLHAVLEKNSALIGHIHASEPDLKPLGDCQTNHAHIGEVIAQYLPHHIVSIEMLGTKTESHEQSIERALVVAAASYRSNPDRVTP